MARDAAKVPGRTGLYQWLADREETAHRVPGSTLPWKPEQPSYTGIPEILMALRAGEPVNIPASALPPWARAEIECHWWTRAIVRPSGSIRFADDDGTQWLAENGL